MSKLVDLIGLHVDPLAGPEHRAAERRKHAIRPAIWALIAISPLLWVQLWVTAGVAFLIAWIGMFWIRPLFELTASVPRANGARMVPPEVRLVLEASIFGTRLCITALTLLILISTVHN